MKGNRKWVDVGKGVGAFTLGAAAGSVAGLLLAPASGRVIRKRIGMKFQSLRHSTVRQIKQAKKLLVKKADHLKQVTSAKLGATRQWLAQRAANGSGNKQPLRRRALQRA